MASANPYPQSLDAFTRQCAAIMSHDTLHRLEAITVPTHVIVGHEDIIILPDRSKVLADRIRGAKLTILPGTGHAAVWECAVAFNNAVIGFIGALAGAV